MGTTRKWKGIELGTIVVLVVDLAATLGAATWGILYLKANVIYIVIIAAISFGLFFLVLAWLVDSSKPRAQTDLREAALDKRVGLLPGPAREWRVSIYPAAG